MKELEILNPWWYEEGWEREDKHLKEWKSEKIRWIPRWIKKISLTPFSLNFVIGPRQVGKTTGLKLLIKNLIERGVDPKEIVYVDVGLIPDLARFKEILFSFKKEKFIFLDEVTSLKEWHRILRGAIDAGIFRNKVIIASGSATIKLRRHAELFPGRKGKGKTIEAMPLSFPEFVRVINKNKTPPPSKLQEIFKNYKLYGGFPNAINKKEKAFADIIDAFESEIAKLEYSIEMAFKIISSILSKIPSALSYQVIAKDIGISYKTVESYLEAFNGLFISNLAYWKDNSRISFRKEKKIFFRDPFIYHAFSFWTGTKFLESALYEGIVQEHLLRKYGEIYYYRNKYEIDCIANNLKVEVKAGKPYRRYPKNVVVLEEEDLPRFLIELFISS